MSSLRESAEWLALKKHHKEISDLSMKEMFAADSCRHNKLSLHFNDILFDFSKNRITYDTLPLLVKLAEQANLTKKIKITI